MALRYSFECPECHSPVELATTQAGQEIPCGSCQATFSAPRLGDIKKLPPVEEKPLASAKRKSRRSSESKSGSPVKSWLFAGGLLLAAITGIAGAAAQDYSNKLHVDVDIEEIAAEELKKIDESAPVDIYAIAVAACDESFQLEYKEVPYRLLNIRSGILQKVAWGCWAVSGVGLLMLLTSFFVKK